MTTAPYLPAPIKVETKDTGKPPNRLLWAGCSLALGILSYYAPKTFLATSVGIFAYQVYRFNQLVQTADSSKHEQIHQWAINACVVMFSVGTVFGITALPSFWFGLKDLRHLHLLHGVGHLTKSALMIFAAAVLAPPFYTGAKDLASRCRWVEMEDYVTNYPPEVKKEILSPRLKQTSALENLEQKVLAILSQVSFYLAALLPQIPFSTISSKENFVYSQFQPESAKFAILKNYFSKNNPNQWHFAIHQFQQLSVEHQLALGPQLQNRVHSKWDRDALPPEVIAVILNETLNQFATIPSDPRSHLYREWLDFSDTFQKLPREQQLVLGPRLFRLVKDDTAASEEMRLAALKAWVRDGEILKGNGDSRTFAIAIFGRLALPFKNEFGVYLNGLIDDGTYTLAQVPLQMQVSLPSTV